MKSQKYGMSNDKYFKLMIEGRRKFDPFQFYRKGNRYDNRLLAINNIDRFKGTDHAVDAPR